MLSSIHVVFDDTLQRAENWLKSLQSLSLPLIKLTTKEEDELPSSIQNLRIS